MRLLWFSWKDITHPLAGGAEEVTHNILSNLVSAGHEVVLITSRYNQAESVSCIKGYSVYRVGGRWTVYFKAWRLFKKKFTSWPDIVIEECNTIPFFSRFYTDKKRIMVFYQLCREVWFYQMTWPLSWIGFLIEPLYLYLLRHEKVITISDSSRNDLIRYGFERENIDMIRLGIPIDRAARFNPVEKYPQPTLLSLGAFRPMKRTLDIVKAFEYAKNKVTRLKLILAGDTSSQYGESVMEYIAHSPYKMDIECLGRVAHEQKRELMQKSHLIAVTSVKEGWGLIVTEANSQGTPAVGYDVDGLRDSIRNNETGLLAKKDSPESLAIAIIELFSDQEKLLDYSRNAWEHSADNTYDNAHLDFMKIITKRFRG